MLARGISMLWKVSKQMQKEETELMLVLKAKEQQKQPNFLSYVHVKFCS